MEIKCSEKSTEESMEIKHFEEDENTQDWFNKNKFKKVLVILTVTNLITKIKWVYSSIITLKTWLIMLEIIQLVKYKQKRSKCIKQNKYSRNKN